MSINKTSHCLFLCLSVLLLFLTSCSANKPIVNALDERDANEIIVFLSSKGIQASKVPSVQSGGGGGGGGKAILWDIEVPPNQAIEAMNYLNQEGLPRRHSENLLEIFSNSSLVPSAMQEKIRYRAGLEQQIANTIRKIDGVLDANVIISFPEKDPLDPSKNITPMTASVYVKHNGVLDDPNSHLVSKIKKLVAASVPGLSYDHVTVVGNRARIGELPNPWLEAMQKQQDQLVDVWSMTIAKTSLPRFRLIFFSFFVLLVLLALIIAWLIWKILPLLKEQGFKQLLSFKHFNTSPPAPPPPVESDKTEESKSNEDESKNIDIT